MEPDIVTVSLISIRYSQLWIFRLILRNRVNFPSQNAIIIGRLLLELLIFCIYMCSLSLIHKMQLVYAVSVTFKQTYISLPLV